MAGTPDRRPPSHPGRRRLIAGGVVAAVIVVAGGAAVFSATQSGTGSRYRVAAVERADVTSTLAMSGQLSSGHLAAPAFQVAGTVSNVLVAVGQDVTAGQKLAALDTTALEGAVTSAKDAVAKATLKLDDDLQAQHTASTATTSAKTAATMGSSARQPSTAASAAGIGSPTDTGAAAAARTVAAAQKTLLRAYASAAVAQQTSAAAAAAAQHACRLFIDAGAGTGSGTAIGTGTAPNGGTDTGSASGTGTTSDVQMLQLCQIAVSATLDAQKATQSAQSAVEDEAKALDSAVGALADGLAVSAPSPASGTRAAPAQLSLNAGSPTSAGAGTAAHTITAAQILADQADVDAAQAQTAVAEQNVGFATLTSPIAGKVVAVSIAAGQTVAAQSTTQTITVQSPGGYLMTATVPPTKIAALAVGQKAAIMLPAFGQAFAGTVSQIGVLNVSQTQTPAYDVTLAVDTAGVSPRIGTTAQATLTLAEASNVLTVPISAVTFAGARASVVVLKNGTPTRTFVQVSAIGTDRVAITSGLSAGDQVVLADLDEPIAVSTSGVTAGLASLGGGGRLRQFVTGGTVRGAAGTGE